MKQKEGPNPSHWDANTGDSVQQSGEWRESPVPEQST